MNRTWDKPINLFTLFNTLVSNGAVLQIFAAVSGYVCSKAQITGGLYPFGIALAAGIDPTYHISATIGAAVGCISFPSGMLFRHIAALFAIVSVRYLLSRYETKVRRPIWSATLCMGVTVLTGAVAASASFSQMLPILAEGVLSGAAAYFIAKSGRAIPLRISRPDESETAGAIIFINILLMGLYSVSFYSISVGRICAIILVLAAGRYGKTAGGAIAGVAAAIALLLTGGSSMGALSIAIGGVFAGMFWSLPRIVSVASIAMASVVLQIGNGDYTALTLALVETALGGIFFFLLPRRLCMVLSGLFSPHTSTPSLEGMRFAVHSRLKDAAVAIYDVTSTVDDVANRLRQINSPSFEQAMSAVEKDACGGCCLRLECWETKRANTITNLVNACSHVQADNFTCDMLNEKYEMGCLRPIQVAQSLKQRYAEYTHRLNAEERLSQIREIVSDQFCGISDMLYELSTEFSRQDCYDAQLAAAAADTLCDMGISVEECGCMRDGDGHLHFEMRIPLTSENVNRADVVTALSGVCATDFAAPNVIRGDEYLLLSVGEKPTFTVETGMCQIPEGSPAQMCGDSANFFDNGHGKIYMVLSDGMGSGGRAAVDGALLSGLLTRMIAAGFSTDCSLKISNAAMLFRSSDESMATADVCCIDLFSGTVKMHKAGAAPTLVRKNGRTGKAESRSLPVGILRDVTFDHAAIDLNDGDIVVMMSDGAVTEGTDWICAELENWEDESAAKLANRIAEGARRRRDDGHSDDITVLTAILHKA